MRHADLIAARLDQLVDQVENSQQAWARDLPAVPVEEPGRQAWRAQVRQIVAYRDRYGITSTKHPLGTAVAEIDDSGVQQRAHEAAAAALYALGEPPAPSDLPVSGQRQRDAQLDQLRRLSDCARTLREGVDNVSQPEGSDRLHRLQARLDEQRRRTPDPLQPPPRPPDGPEHRGPSL